MKKVIFIVLVVFIGLLIFFSSTIFIENVRSSISKKIEENENNITVVDVTSLENSKGIEHEHIYKTMYDEINHWEECVICEQKNNIVTHNFTTSWASKTESCIKSNSYIKTCLCGYSEAGHKPCVWNGKTYGTDSGMYSHYKKCSKEDNGAIKYLYYLNTYGVGDLYLINYANSPSKEYTEYERCYKSDGTLINSGNLGKCTVCGHNYTQKIHYLIEDLETNEVYCQICGKNYGTFEQEVTIDSNSPAKYTIITNLKLANGATFKGTRGMRGLGSSSSVWDINSQAIISGAVGGTNITLRTVGKFKSTRKEPYENYVAVTVSIGGVDCALMTNQFIVYPDFTPPTISKIDNSELTNWSKNKTITISGTENWTETVECKILDDEGNTVYTGRGDVTSGAYSISCIPDIEAGEVGRTFTAVVTDACNNTTEQEFTIAKIDGVAPEILSGNNITGEWVKERNFTFIATDQGSGNVQIAFNDINDYKLATKDGENYLREYKFVGDSYQPTSAKVFYKDEIGNVTSQEVTIDKIDNTVPTITEGRVHNNKVIIESNDRHESLGEGSGVNKYRYITSTEKLDNPMILSDSGIEVNVTDDIIIDDIFNVKYVYVVAEDLVREC